MSKLLNLSIIRPASPGNVLLQGQRYGVGGAPSQKKLQGVGKKFHAVGKELKVSNKKNRNVTTIKVQFNF